MWNVKKRLGIE